MSLLIGDVAPDFEADTTEGRIRFHEWIGEDWVVFFSHPADFTPVCTTELGYTAKLKDEFARRGAKALVISVDSLEDHKNWISDIEETQDTTVEFPIIADPDRSVATLYNMIHPSADAKVTVRAVYVIDPNKKIRASIIYPPSAGRNFDEILRLIDSLQLTDNHKVATPVNWQNGDDVIIVPSLTDPDEIDRLFPSGYKAVKPYLRYTAQPGK
ncbi:MULTISPECIES: peroxiredoxin [Hyphomonas]|uniref:Peroxidase n=1 Tax=Hyphomonas atlantica TaxID=1280948 RepID=A0A059EB55_9PROT|nr:MULTISPECIES: peroxiredoxin [Hyphomonas]KCZ65159.1 peroxidase [Hyphomonas atlantica]MAM06310.1 peroxiredoxin [Hyphomonas sp.]HBF90372.1 peroxiredoxin [Hyphomonas atlantica]HBH44913.1 peroxiredoxin [Hyphomonas atlantica]HBQ48426.1 peroxiredoxin [Hyphomonas atlantica]|tara:strand:- start:789 stop:1427 length:639 start_codon:yes stop_codon:yes gene_type:complete